MSNKVEMFWVAEYSDGTAIAQFDPDTGTENLFADVDQARLTKLTWYPVTEELAAKTSEVNINPFLNPISLIVPEGKRARIFRLNSLEYSLLANGAPKQTIEAYVLGIEGNPLLVYTKRDGSIELREGSLPLQPHDEIK